MYAAFGDVAEQQRIRDANPGKNHCAFLKRDPAACDTNNGRCPVKLNPYTHPEQGRVLRLVEEHHDDALEAIGMCDEPLAADAPHETTLAVNIARRELRYAEIKLMADLVGVKVAEVMAKAFGSAK